MTQEEKQLLLKDLCARLPYGVMMKVSHLSHPIALDEFILFTIKTSNKEGIQGTPYLRPLSSMTEKEKKEFDGVIKSCNNKVFACPVQERRYIFFDAEQEDFMNAHHFDYRGLIERGLALKAPEGMYK